MLAVVPPRLDLLNEELLRTHLHAIFLSELGLPGLRDSVPDLLDLNQSTLPLREEVADALKLKPAEAARVRTAFEKAIADFRSKLTNESAPWFSQGWIDVELGCLKERLDESLERWRGLHRSAQTQLNLASQKINSGLYPASSPEFKEAQLEQRLAQRQLDLLRNEVTSGELSEFYVYRYLAAEGFLPGYNFIRCLPFRTEAVFAILFVLVVQLPGVISREQQLADAIVTAINTLKERVRSQFELFVSPQLHGVGADCFAVARLPNDFGQLQLVKASRFPALFSVSVFVYEFVGALMVRFATVMVFGKLDEVVASRVTVIGMVGAEFVM